MPEFAAPGLGRESNDVTIELEVGDQASGVLYAVGGAGGGLAVYMENCHLVYEYNMMIIENYRFKSMEPITPGKHRIVISTVIEGPGKSGTASIVVDGKKIGAAKLVQTVPAAFSATESFDVGIDLGSPVSSAYAEKRPFEFNGTIDSLKVELK